MPSAFAFSLLHIPCIPSFGNMCGFRPETTTSNADSMAMAANMMRHRMAEIYRQGVEEGRRSTERELLGPPVSCLLELADGQSRKRRYPSGSSTASTSSRTLASIEPNAAGPSHSSTSSSSSDDYPFAKQRHEALQRLEETKRRRISVSPEAPTGSTPQRRIRPPQIAAANANTASRPIPVGPPLSEQQQGILQQVLDGESVFVTGSAGTGKSVLIRAIIAAFRKREMARTAAIKAGEEVEDKNWILGVTASTGLSAL